MTELSPCCCGNECINIDRKEALSKTAKTKLGPVVCLCTLSTGETGGSGIQGMPQLCAEFQACLGEDMIPVSKHRKGPGFKFFSPLETMLP